jgi:hypothetical protein
MHKYGEGEAREREGKRERWEIGRKREREGGRERGKEEESEGKR